MRNGKKVLAMAMAVAMAATCMVGCGSSDSKKSDKVTLKVTTTYAGEDTNAKNYKDAVKAWEKQTGNKVEDSSATSDETFKSRILTDFQTGSEPDVLFFFNGVDANEFIKEGKVVSIDEIRKEYPEYADNMKDDLIGASPVDDVKYAVPVNGYWEGMFVNKKVCKEAGVDVPTAETTYEEFLDICKKIKDAGYTPIAASLQEIPHYWFEYGIYNFTTPATHNAVPAKADDAQGKAWTDGLNDIKDLYEKGFFPENTLTATDAETFQLFTADKAAFLIDGSWKIGGIKEAVDEKDLENFTVTYVPGKNERKTTDIIGGISMGYYITKKAWEDEAKRDAAVKFVEYMTSDEMVGKFAGTSVTALKNEVKAEGELSVLEQDALTFCGGVTGISGAVQDNLDDAARVPVFGDMPQIVKGKKAASDAVAEVIKIKSEE